MFTDFLVAKKLSDSVHIDNVNGIKHLDESDDASYSALSSSCSYISDSEDSTSTSDGKEGHIDKLDHRSVGRSQNHHQIKHNKTARRPDLNYQHEYVPYWYGYPYSNYGWLPWNSYQNPYCYPTFLSQHPQYSKLQENLDIQSEYITLMLKK